MNHAVRVCMVAAWLVVGCSARTQTAVHSTIASVRALPLVLSADGLSGLTEDGHGNLWAVSEGQELVRIEASTGSIDRFVVEGLPKEAEPEAIVWVDRNQFLIGTETDASQRKADPLVLLEMVGDRARPVVQSMCDYGMWGLLASSNRGVEGLCRVGDKVVVGTELVQVVGKRRYAPVALFDLRTGAWNAFMVQLTSDDGKLSALACKAEGSEIDVRAIERHFDVSRLIKFRISLSPIKEKVHATVVADLDAPGHPDVNLEGLVWRRDGSIVVVSDNRYRGEQQGRSRIFQIDVAP